MLDKPVRQLADILESLPVVCKIVLPLGSGLSLLVKLGAIVGRGKLRLLLCSNHCCRGGLVSIACYASARACSCLMAQL